MDALQSFETQLKERIIAELPKSQASGVAGKLARVQLDSKPVPRVVTQDEAGNEVAGWSQVYEYIRRNKRFDLLQRRLSEGAVKEMWDEGKEIPGIEKFTIVTVSCTKLGGKK